MDTSAQDNQDYYDYRRRDPEGGEMHPLVLRLVKEPHDWQQVSDICFVDEREMSLILVSPTGDAFIAIYFNSDDRQSRVVDMIASNGNVAALLMLVRLVQQFKV